MSKDSKEKNSVKDLKKSLFYNKKNAYQILKDDEIKKINKFSEGYKSFLDASKTEREACEFAVEAARDNGFKEYKRGMKLKAGDKIYVNNRGKAVILAVIGTDDISDGLRICAAHIDSPRLDLKQCPVYEDSELALFKTHYYGGIKKYQWTTVPLSLHGVLVKSDGSKITVNIGEDPEDPQFVVNDLLIHLAADQMKKPLMSAIEGEDLNILIGSRPFKSDEGSDLVKLNILNILYEKYGITEEDFLSAELEAVPACKARDIGFDRSMVGGYGHDDRVCAYPALEAILTVEEPEKTSVVVLTDKEETGSEGNTGLQSSYLRYFISDLASDFGVRDTTVFSNSQCMSSDVNAGFDPTYPNVMEKMNCAFLNYGVVITKYTGSRGKSGTSDASAEFTGRIRNLLNKNNVIWQTGELGKVDCGGGGTVAAYIANLNIDTIDVGVPVLSMHAPFEVISKVDVYMAYRAFKVFLED
ncbi:MAG: aminopeptidase [Oscillospiraceae bacterium]|nr:aminopeptidase [Oscillospiraceae bacterium]